MRHYGKCEWVTGVVLYEILGPWIPPKGEEKKNVPPRFVVVKKERNEKYIYFLKKNQKIRINMKP